MSELIIDGDTYLCTKMPTRVQFHVARRMLPVIAPLLASQNTIIDGDGNLMLEDIPPMEALAGLMANISSLTDADLDYVIDNALNAVKWRQGNNWVNLRVPGGQLMNLKADDLATQLRLLWEVLVTSLGNFSVGKLQQSQTEAPMLGNGMAQ